MQSGMHVCSFRSMLAAILLGTAMKFSNCFSHCLNQSESELVEAVRRQ